MNKGQVAKVHQAWDSRYHYDLENRRMTSMYNGEEIGRIRGRDKVGRVNYDRYWVLRPFKGENLLKYHNARLDALRDSRWEDANQVLVEARKTKLSEIATIEENQDEPEQVIEDESTTEDDFVPAPFIPQGIDVPSQDIPPLDGDSESGLLPPVNMEPEPPSPFAPLPPL